MPSTYSPSLKIELIGNGEQTGTWGQTTNNNMGTLIEQAITGVGQIPLYGDYTLTNYNGLPDEARNAVLVFSGSLSSPANVITPAVEKTYIITNNTGANVTLKTSTGTGVVIGNGLSSLVYCDGSEFYTAVNVNNVIGDLAVSGNETVGGSVTLGGALTFANSITNTSGNLTFTANSNIIDMSTNTGALVSPIGTTAQRPATPQPGMSRWNTDVGAYEIWTGFQWQIIASGAYNVTYLLIAGGGGGGSGGGGGGGFLTGSTSVQPTTAYSVVVGSGGGTATVGANSTALGATALGGGYGAYNASGGSGGSGGGAGGNGSGGSGTSGQGYAGGSAPLGANNGGGGGGAGGQGGNGQIDPSVGGSAGPGAASSITGSSVYYSGGGGGNDPYGGVINGGIGGGGQGASGSGGSSDNNATSGTANTGGGGGGGQGTNGGSGVVIISYVSTTQRGSGGTITSYSSGGSTYWVHKFTSSGSYQA